MESQPGITTKNGFYDTVDFKVLVVDDEKIIRHVCQMSLQKAGFEVETVENGLSALELLRHTDDIGIVITDMKMPGMSGLELLEHIKRDFTHIEVIIMTGYATIESAITAMKLGAYDFILKPLQADQIRMVVNKCREKIQLSNENLALRRAYQKLREVQIMKDKFLAITSHELRTPVSHLKGYLSILTDEMSQDLRPEEKEDCWRIILTAVNDLEDIVNSMFDVYQLESDKMILRRELVNIDELLEQVVSEFRLPAQNRKQTIELHLPEKPRTIHADRLKLKSMISELIQNAIKFTPDGGRITVRSYEEDNFVIITVEDTGIGIPEDEQGKIFEKFYEVQNSDYHSTGSFEFKGGGLGIGLSLARAVAEAHGGGIKLKSEVNKGSEFKVFLPWDRSENGAETENPMR